MDSGSPSGGDTAASAAEAAHDLPHQVHLLREALQSEKRRVGFFVGAGCPLGIYDADGNMPLNHIPDVAGLTSAIGTKLEGDQKNSWMKLIHACTAGNLASPNVEHVLTQLRTILALKGGPTVDGMTADGLQKLDEKICQLIAEIVGKPLPAHTSSYDHFAAWLRGGTKEVFRVHPVEIFTTNYDLLVEEALEKAGVPFFDGFVGTREPFFDLLAMEQDSLPQRWTRFWKLHGSVNWIKRKDGTVYRTHKPGTGEQLLIYPSHLKYEQSRRMPYLAMIDRFRAFFRDPNSILVLCGYSFADEHLNEVLLDGLHANRSAHCTALMYLSLKDCELAKHYASKAANLTILARDGAVIGTRVGRYSDLGEGTKTMGVEKEDTPGKGARCTLGDFHHLGRFLEQQSNDGFRA